MTTNQKIAPMIVEPSMENSIDQCQDNDSERQIIINSEKLNKENSEARKTENTSNFDQSQTTADKSIMSKAALVRKKSPMYGRRSSNIAIDGELSALDGQYKKEGYKSNKPQSMASDASKYKNPMDLVKFNSKKRKESGENWMPQIGDIHDENEEKNMPQNIKNKMQLVRQSGVDDVQFEIDKMDRQLKVDSKVRVGSAKSKRKMNDDMAFLQKLEKMDGKEVSLEESVEMISKRGKEKSKNKRQDSGILPVFFKNQETSKQKSSQEFQKQEIQDPGKNKRQDSGKNVLKDLEGNLDFQDNFPSPVHSKESDESIEKFHDVQENPETLSSDSSSSDSEEESPQHADQMKYGQHEKNGYDMSFGGNVSPDKKQIEMQNLMGKVQDQKKTKKKKTGLKITLNRKGSMNSSNNDYDNDALPQLNDEEFKSKNQEKLQRMKHRDDKKDWILYPEDQSKTYWDIYITLILLITCLLTPWRIAFGEEEDPIEWQIISYSIDGFFLIDIIVLFFSAFYDEEFAIIDNHKLIAVQYLKGWFMIDLIAIIPFELILKNNANYGDVARIARVGRMYKLIKMTKLLRILKIIKEKSKLLKYLNEIFKIGLGMERLFFFVMIFFIVSHIVACVWIISCQLSQTIRDDGSVDYTNTWMDQPYILGIKDNDVALYLTSFYFTISTITTVGYGDISGQNTIERSMGIIIMLIGVMAFSFATGSLSSILQNYDQANAKLQERITVLNRIYKDYMLPLELYQRMKQVVKYDSNKDQEDINQFVMELPHKLKLEVSLYIHEHAYKRIHCFQGRSSAFISYVCPLLKPRPFPEKQYVFFEGDDVTNVYFLIKGKGGFVLPKYKNTAYIEIPHGSHFGIIDIVGSILKTQYELDNWFTHKDQLQRQFTVMALQKCETMLLTIGDLYRMKQEFLEAYEKLFNDSYSRLRRALTLKLKAMKMCQDVEDDIKSQKSIASVGSGDQQQRNISKKLTLTSKEQLDLKGEEIDYQINAVQLGKIDEVSIESSSNDAKSQNPQDEFHSDISKVEAQKTFDNTPKKNQKPEVTPSDQQDSGEGDVDSFKYSEKEKIPRGDSFVQGLKKSLSQKFENDFNEDDPADIFANEQEQKCDSDEEREKHEQHHRDGMDIIAKVKALQKNKQAGPVKAGLAPPNQSSFTSAATVSDPNMNNALSMIMARLDTFQETQSKQYNLMANKIEKIEKRLSIGPQALSNQLNANTPKKDKTRRGSLIIPGGMLPMLSNKEQDSEDIKQIEDFYNNLKS